MSPLYFQRIRPVTHYRYLFFLSQNYSFPVLRPLQEVILQRGDEVKWFLYGNEIDYTLLYANEIQINDIESIIEYNPHAVFVPGNVVPSFIPGVKVEIFHGLPSKKTKKNGQLYHYIIREMFDLYCTHGPQSTKIFEQLSHKYKNFSVIETGWSKLDPLFSKHDSIKKRKQKVIFFASTFSPRFSKARILYPYIKRMIHSHNYHWYITLHPKMPQDVVSLYQTLKSEKVTLLDATQVIESFSNADIMLCDTSSIMYEFLTQNKPVITFQTQEDEEIFINIKDINVLEQTIVHTLKNSDTYHKTIKQFVKDIHPYTDGKSSQRILDATVSMINGNNLPKKQKPWNIIRNFKLRLKFKYWKF